MFIENNHLKVEVQQLGGSLTSIFDKDLNKELMYQPIPESWSGQDHFIFPFVARLKDNLYTYKGKTYELLIHGLLRSMEAKMEKLSATKMRVSFTSDTETKKRYPFDFEASLNYELKGKTLSLTYNIKNKSQETMPYMLGAHPAFALPGERKENEFDISGNSIELVGLDKAEILLEEETFCYMTGETSTITSPIQLNKELFRKINTVIIKADNFQELILRKKDGTSLLIKKNDAPYVALWSDMQYGNYVCIEPWNGLPDTLNVPRELSSKPGIQMLEPGKTRTYTYEIIPM